MDAQTEWQNIVSIFTDLDNVDLSVCVPSKATKRKFKSLMGHDSSSDDDTPKVSQLTPESYFNSVLNPSEDEKLSDELMRASVIPVKVPETLKKRKMMKHSNMMFLKKVEVKAMINPKPLPVIPKMNKTPHVVVEEKVEIVTLGSANEFGVQMREGYNIRDWQAEAVRWTLQIENGENPHVNWSDPFKQGGILAMQVGLGKTCVAATIILQSLVKQKRQSSCSLYITEKNLMVQMMDDVKLLFGGQLKCLCVHRDYMSNKLKLVDRALLQKYDVVVTNYHTISTMFNTVNMEPHCLAMRTFKWFRVILDESHNIRNRTTNCFRNLSHLVCQRRLCMTGTPIHNTLKDVINQLEFTGFQPPSGKVNVKQFEDMKLDNRILFMEKKHAASLGMKLMKKSIDVVYYELSNEERYLHDYFKNRAKTYYMKTLTDVGSEVNKDRACMMSNHLRTLQVCTAPYLVTPQSKYKSSDNMVEIKGELNLPQEHNMVQWVNNEMGSAGIGSSKMKRFISLVNELRDQYVELGDKFKLMVYTNHTSTLYLALKALASENHEWRQRCLVVHGQSGSAKKRNEMYDVFRNDDKVEILFMTLKSGCAGLNFQRTCHLQIHLEIWHSYASHLQAIGRVDRLGQLNDVQIYFLIAKNSAEERVYNLCMDKKELAEDVANIQDRDLSLQAVPMDEILFD